MLHVADFPEKRGLSALKKSRMRLARQPWQGLIPVRMPISLLPFDATGSDPGIQTVGFLRG